MTTQAQYEKNERIRFLRDLARIEDAPLKERQEQREALKLEITDNIKHFFQSAEWLLDGHYGFGVYHAMQEIVNSRMNTKTLLFQYVSALEYRCPSRFANQVWNNLPVETQDLINSKFDDLLNEFKMTI